MLTIRELGWQDLSVAQQLSAAAGWNQTPEDWARFLQLAPTGCFVAELDEQRVGTVTTCQFDAVAWVGMMLVDSRWRRQGIGRALLEHALEYLERDGVDCVRLDATAYGKPLYDSLGFQAQFSVWRYAGRVACQAPTQQTVRRLHNEDWTELLSVDRSMARYDRSRLLVALMRAPETRCWISADHSPLSGYVMRRPGRLATMIGPCVAKHATSAQQLLTSALSELDGCDVVIDIPEFQASAVAVAQQFGLHPSRSLLRMVRGRDVVEDINLLFASSGPEMG